MTVTHIPCHSPFKVYHPAVLGTFTDSCNPPLCLIPKYSHDLKKVRYILNSHSSPLGPAPAPGPGPHSSFCLSGFTFSGHFHTNTTIQSEPPASVGDTCCRYSRACTQERNCWVTWNAEGLPEVSHGAAPPHSPTSSVRAFSFLHHLFSRQRGREGEREGEKHQCVVASHVPPTGDLAHNPGMCPDWESNR